MRTYLTRETITALGHKNIQATHPSTLMITTDKHITRRGDCVVAVAANKALTEMKPEFKCALRNPGAKLTILIEANDLKQQVTAAGSPNLILMHANDMVVRKSDYISDRTLAIHADKAANDLPRPFIKKLQNQNQEVKITLIVEV